MIKINSLNKTYKLTLTAIFGAFAMALMLIEIPLPFIAPPFYKLDLSEIPVLVGSFALGPVSGVFIELIKIILKLLIKGTETAFVGEISNFIIGIVFILPSAIIYKNKKTKKNAIISLILSSIIMSIVAVFLNAFLLIPFYSNLYHLPVDQIVAMGNAIFPVVTDLFTLCICCVLPFNLIKCIVVSSITIVIYKPLSKTIHKVNDKFTKNITE